MRAHQVSRLSNAEVERELAERVSQGWNDTAVVLALIAEVDERRLYVPAGYPSMHAYCVEKLRFSEDAAYKRIRAGRLCRQFPALFEKVARGELHLAALCLLAPHMTLENADELMAVATHRRKSEIEELVARRFPDRNLPVILRPISGESDFTKLELAPGRVDACANDLVTQLAPAQVGAPAPQLAPGPVEEHPKAPERFLLQVMIDKATRDELQYSQALLSHCVPSGDIAQVLSRALRTMNAYLEKRKFGASSKPRAGHRAPKSKRCIPADVRHAVWVRDQGMCTFVGDGGHRCGSRKFLEFDHVEPVARGGEATVAGVRLRCRAHNQYEAERTFGAGFMHEKRSRARSAVGETGAKEQKDPQAPDIMAGLRGLGFRADEARRAIEMTGELRHAPLEECFRAALKVLSRRLQRSVPVSVEAISSA